MTEVTLSPSTLSAATYQIDAAAGTINGMPTPIVLEQTEAHAWSAAGAHRTHRAVVHSVDVITNTVILSINGKKVSVALRSRVAQMLKTLGVEGGSQKKLDTLKAPMPGLIRQVLVQPGDSVKKGDALLILEAMKMENVIKAAGDGVVASVQAVEKATVEKGALLIKFV